MAGDSLDAGIAPGGLRDRNEVKVLVCYLLRTAERPLSFTHLSEILLQDGLVNYFELGQAIGDLLATGHIDQIDEPDGPFYKPTRLGIATAGYFERDLPLTVREKAMRAALRLLSRLRREEESNVTIERSGQGWLVSCAALDRSDELMRLSLLLPTQELAQEARSMFVERSDVVYRGVLALLTGDAEGLGAIADEFAGEQKLENDAKPESDA